MRKYIIRSTLFVLGLAVTPAQADGLFSIIGLTDHCTDCYVRQVTPTVYQTVPTDIVVRRSRRVVEHVPAQYRNVVETVMVRPERIEVRRVPAVVETRQERVMVKAAHREWQHQRDVFGRDVLCEVDVPAQFETITRYVEVQPARVEQVRVAAQFAERSRRVLVAPARQVVSMTAPLVHTIPTLIQTAPRTERWVPSYNPDHLPHSGVSGRL